LAGIFSFRCTKCKNIHEGSPSFSFKAPAPWLEQTENVRKNGKLSDDFCVYRDEDGTHHFVRVVIEIPIQGVTAPFLWGVWVSLSETSFKDYLKNWDSPKPNTGYFGWLCNRLPYYKDTYALASDVCIRTDGTRPFLQLHEVDHELYEDSITGISIQKAQRIAESAMHP
jgi:hypothetical protein